MKLLIISDIHANWAALQAVLKTEADADRILCLGDLVDYGPEPVLCVGWALQQQSKGTIFVQGNHDWGVAEKKDPRASPPYRQLAATTQAFCLSVLSAKMQAFLRPLPQVAGFHLGDRRCFACHAMPSEPRFSYWRGDEKELRDEIELAESPDFLFVGHTHWPLLRSIDKTTVVNPGSVGQPKDGDPSAAYAVFEDSHVELRRADYSIEETVRSYSSTPLSASDVRALTEVLRTGGTLPASFECSSSSTL
jgi:putative phosphoesterase